MSEGKSIAMQVAGEDMPVVFSYGGGTNSAAILIELINRGYSPPDAILFSDTGSEWPHTYEHIALMNQYALDHGYPEITTVRVHQPSKHGGLYKMLTINRMLPSVAYGYKNCSVQYKIEPQNTYVKKRFGDAKHIRIIGYDYDELHRAEKGKAVTDRFKSQVPWYPLIEWEMGRDECLASIAGTGIKPAGKSSCFFCPNAKRHQIQELAQNHKELFDKCVTMENLAAERQREEGRVGGIIGLGRSWRWQDLIATDDMFGFPEPHQEEPCGCYDGSDD
jgi:hypothetical protein